MTRRKRETYVNGRVQLGLAGTGAPDAQGELFDAPDAPARSARESLPACNACGGAIWAPRADDQTGLCHRCSALELRAPNLLEDL